MNCIKCGREIPEGQMFCQECKLPTVPLPAEPAPMPKVKKSRVKKKKKHKKKFDLAKTVRRMSIALTVVSLLFAGLCAIVALELNSFLSRKEDLRQREASVTLREKEANNRDDRIDELERTVTGLEEALATAQKTIDLLQTDGSQSRR